METKPARVPAVLEVDRFAVYRAYPLDGFCLFRHCMPSAAVSKEPLTSAHAAFRAKPSQDGWSQLPVSRSSGQHPSRPRRCHKGLRPMYSRRRTCADRKHRPRWDKPGRRQFRGLAGASGGWLAALAADSPWPPPAIYGHLSSASTSEPIIRVMSAPGLRGVSASTHHAASRASSAGGYRLRRHRAL